MLDFIIKNNYNIGEIMDKITKKFDSATPLLWPPKDEKCRIIKIFIVIFKRAVAFTKSFEWKNNTYWTNQIHALKPEDISNLSVMKVIRSLKTTGVFNFTPNEDQKTWFIQALTARTFTTLKTCIPLFANTRLFVEEPENPLETSSIKKYRFPSQKELTFGLHTTTLSNIICTNELEFDTEKVQNLVEELIESKPDLSQVDHTRHCSLRCPDIQNNPLKSLIALDNGHPFYDNLIKKMLAYIKTLPTDKAQEILDHKDNFPLGSMPAACFLIRQGRDHLAIEAYKAGATINLLPSDNYKTDLELACASFGTFLESRKEEGSKCVDYMLDQLLKTKTRLTEKIKNDCLAALKKGSYLQNLNYCTFVDDSFSDMYRLSDTGQELSDKQQLSMKFAYTKTNQSHFESLIKCLETYPYIL